MILGHGGHVAATPGHEALGVWSPAGALAPTEAELADYASLLSRACGDGAERALTIMRAVGAHSLVLWQRFGLRPNGTGDPAAGTRAVALSGAGGAGRMAHQRSAE